MPLTPEADNYDIEFNNGILLSESQPSYTHKMDIEKEKVSGYCDRIEAVKQAVYKALNTDRYAYPIYSHNYGVELSKLFGKPSAYVYPEIQRMIEEGLAQDDRIRAVNNFEFSDNRGKVFCKFHVLSVYGEFDSEVEYQYM